MMKVEGLRVEGLQVKGGIMGGVRRILAVPVELARALDRLAGSREHSQFPV